MSILDTDLHHFINNLRILRSIDPTELDRALGRPVSGDHWLAFQKDPYRFLMGADSEMAGAIWRIIEGRQPKREAA